MSVPSFIYDAKFSPAEQKQIKRLRWLDKQRPKLSWGVGITVFFSVFLLQLPFRGIDAVHAIASYGCIPAGAAAGVGISIFLDRYIEKAFIDRWDPLFFERSGQSSAEHAAQQEILGLTDRIEFVSLPIERQRAIVNEIYRKHGLPEPNKSSN